MMANDKRRDTREYWEARLKRMGLSMSAGEGVAWQDGKPVRWLSYGHTVTDLDFDGRNTYTPTAGEIEERQEWPISLS